MYFRQNILDKYGRTTECPGCIGIGPHTEDCRARIEQEMLAKGGAIKLETRQEHEGNPRESRKPVRRKGKTDESAASSCAEDTSKRGESEHAPNVESSTLLTGCIAAVNEILCDTPSVDLSHDRIAQTGKFPEDARKAVREFELRNTLNF